MDKFADLVTHQYINLITYRKSGEMVATPVWFVHENHRLYVGTGRNAGKIKRIRNNPLVEIEPCDARGKPLGARIKAQARVLAVDEHVRIHQLLNRKYGLMKRIIDLISLINGSAKTGRDVVEITQNT